MFGILFWLFIAGIFYVYVGYPFLLAAFARLFSRPTLTANDLPPITLLIAAYNEEVVIAQKLENSLSLDYPCERLQIIVAADGSDDNTAAIVQSFASRGVDLSYDAARRGKMSAINRAMKIARNEIIVFSDANNFYQLDALKILVSFFADPNVGAVSGSKHILSQGSKLGESEGLYWKYESFLKRQESRLGSCTGVAGEIFAVRRALFVPPPQEIINDDFYIALQILRQGYRIQYAPKAVSMERVSQSEQDEIVRRTRIVAGRYQAIGMSLSLLPFRQPLTVWQIVSHKYLRPLVPFFMLGALLTNIFALVFSEQGKASLLYLSGLSGWTTLGLQIIFYLSAWFGGRYKGRGFFSKLLYLPTFLVNSNLAALLGFFKYITGRQSVIWKRAPR